MVSDNLQIPEFPQFVQLDKKYRKSLKDLFLSLKDGISELTFDSLIIHNGNFNHKISKNPNSDSYILIGTDEYDEKIKTFFSILEGEKKLQNNKIFFEEILPQCFSQYKFWKLMSQTQYESYNEILQAMNVVVEFDRDNSDYIYNRTDLQNLPGKDFHKKKNLVNAFLKNSNISIKNLDTTNTKDAFRILQIWSENRNLKQTDYYQCIDALNDISQNNSILSGITTFIVAVPTG